MAEVLDRLEAARLTLRPEKCQFFQEQVIYLGHHISANGIYPKAVNISKVKEYPVPTNLRGLRCFVGLATYYRKFVENFSKVAKPLTDLTKKRTRWKWD